MLSLDFTDHQVKIVRGSLLGSKIRIIQAETLNLASGLIENGFISDIPMLASEILEFLQSNDIKEKEVVAEIGSGLILNKELVLPKPKNMKNSGMIESMIQSNMNLNADYNISFNIVGEAEDENKNPLIRVLATAVPQRLVDGYTRLFSHLGIPLKSLYVSSGCISRLVENDAKMASLSPLMMVQVEYDFITTNLYDSGRLLLSRRVTIDSEEIAGDADALVQAVYDNVYRMIQFMNSRPDSKPLQEIAFYGKIPDFVLLSNAMSSFNTKTRVLVAPGNVAAFCEYEFAEYANAISAFYRSKSDFDRVDLLKSSAAKEKKPTSFYGLILVGSLLGACLIVGGAFFAVSSINNNLQSQINSVNDEIAAAQPRVDALNAKINQLNNFSLYSDNIQIAKYLVDFQPTMYSQICEKIEEVLSDGMYVEGDVSFDGKAVTVSFICTEQNQPSEYVEKLVEQDYFDGISYYGFNTSVPTDEEIAAGNDKQYTRFGITMFVKGGNAYEIKQ